MAKAAKRFLILYVVQALAGIVVGGALPWLQLYNVI